MFQEADILIIGAGHAGLSQLENYRVYPFVKPIYDVKKMNVYGEEHGIRPRKLALGPRTEREGYPGTSLMGPIE
ncbi:MAG: hypothetical protein ACW992_11620 [Candidatus Thorarchaeota archaeon]|jgi:hypothetical protein